MFSEADPNQFRAKSAVYPCRRESSKGNHTRIRIGKQKTPSKWGFSFGI